MGDLLAGLKNVVVNEDVRAALQHLVHKPQAEQIGDLVVDHIELDMSGLEEVTEEDKEILKKVLGPDLLRVRIAPVGKDILVMVFGGGSKRLAAVADLAAKGKAPLAGDPGIMHVASKLPKARLSEVYLAFDHLLQLVLRVAELSGTTLPVQPVENAAPAGFSSSCYDNSLRVDVFVPMELIVAVKDVIMQIMAGMTTTSPAAPPAATPVPAPTF
jgi:hypothetical protein